MVRVIRWTFIGVRLIFPWIVRVFGWMISLALTAGASLWVGVPNAVRKVADHWVDRAVIAGFPTEYDSLLFYTVSVVAFLNIIAGWILLAFGTVYLLGLLF